MGIGFRVFLVDSDDSLQRLSMAHYERLLQRKPRERLPQYAGKRVRCAMVMLEVAGRKPLAINRIDYSMLSFDAEGRIDVTEREKEARLAVEAMPPFIEEQRHGQVIDARSHFAKKRYKHEFKWIPSREIEAAIVAAVFGRGLL